jgi:hypothetical protein
MLVTVVPDESEPPRALAERGTLSQLVWVLPRLELLLRLASELADEPLPVRCVLPSAMRRRLSASWLKVDGSRGASSRSSSSAMLLRLPDARP